MQAQILPLAITMMAGPQILTAILRITGPNPIKPSAAYVGAVALASASVTALLMIVIGLLDSKTGFSQTGGEPSQAAKVLQSVFIALLIAFAIKNWRHRDEIKQPKWMAAMQDADAKKCFTLGFTLIALMPTDLMAMSAVATNLVSNGLSYIDAAPFLLLTWFIAALPLLSYLVFRKRAIVAMPKVRDWMNDNSYLVNIALCVLFIYLIAS
jgi:uncharacterized membrane protein YtjA (UPF0391 family)